jgi:hypothetical protein
MIIDSTYFKGDISLPNLDSSWNSENLNNFITKYEKIILMDLLGSDLYLKYIAGIAAVTPDVIWTNLRDGCEYTVDYNGSDYIVKWEGLKNSDKISLLSYFTYFYLVKDGHISLGGVSTSVNKTQNSETISPIKKLVNAWNQGVEIYGTVLKSSYENKVIVNGLTYFQPTQSDLLNPSAYNFLYNHSDDYPTWVFTEKKYINTLGI